MAQVTYRGVKYDTNKNKPVNEIKSDLVYRGIKYTETKSVAV